MRMGFMSANALPVSPLSGDSSVDAHWHSLEGHLVEALQVLRTDSGGVERLSDLRHRMKLYSLVYSACSLSVVMSHEIYKRLSTFLLNDLEVHVLQPLLHQCVGCTPQQLCLSFVEQCIIFKYFCRFVISCFSYLDQYYTRKYHIDSIGVLCMKMFYVVVYEPLRERIVMGLILLANEERALLLDSSSVSATADSHVDPGTRRTLTSIVEIISEVKTHSQSAPYAFPCAQTRLTLDRIAEEARIFRQTQNDPPIDVNVSPPNSSYINAFEGDEERSLWTTEGTLERIRQLREGLECCSLGDLISGGPSGDAVALSHPEVVNLVPPPHIVLFADFGLLYVERAKAFYRDRRSTQLEVHQCRGYVDWVEQILHCEWLLAWNIGEPVFYRILCTQLCQVLLVEPHRKIVLDEEAGFRSLLDAFMGRCTTLSSGGDPSSYWETLSHSEMAKRLTQIFYAFAGQEDEACGVLLASEFASKVVLDLAPHFIAYMSKESPTVPQPCPSHLGDVQNNPSMALVAVIEDIVRVYKDVVRNQFDNDPRMHAALSDALQEMVNPEHWDAAAPRRVVGAVATTATGLPNILLSHDAAKRILPALANLAAVRGTVELFVPQLFAAYCDRLCQRPDYDDVAGRVDRIVFLVQLLDDKDVFVEHYRLLLARRLLASPNSQGKMEVEHMVIQKLLHALGRVVVYSLDAMLRDYENSSAASEAFEQTDVYGELPATFHAHVLTAVHWPAYRVLRMVPCASLKYCTDAFTRHYGDLHPSRTLRWVHSLGTALLSAVFPGGTKEITASTVQATILVLASEAYSSGRGISGAAIAAATGMHFGELRAHLDFLTLHNVYGLLRRCGDNASGPLSPEEEVALNEKYTHKLRKLRLPVVRSRPQTVTRGEDEECGTEIVPVAVDGMRRFQVDAAIIRVMKTHRSLRYYELVEETTQQLSRIFNSTPGLIKARVEELVAREFLRRSEEHASVFEYVA